jgi:hypothetical protein
MPDIVAIQVDLLGQCNHSYSREVADSEEVVGRDDERMLCWLRWLQAQRGKSMHAARTSADWFL